MTDSKTIKEKTLELYAQLPQDEEERKKRIYIRDQIIELNYAFFGYIASHTFINNSSVTYEDKLQSALCHFCECWWWYKWEKKYRTDLSFCVFYKLRIGEMIERELNEVKYSIRRALCMEVGEQVGKHWGQVKYEDLSDPRLKLPVAKMNSLKAIFGSLYIADLETHEPFIASESTGFSDFERSLNDDYEDISELLIREMVERERRLSNSDIAEIEEIYGIDQKTIKSKLSTAEKILYQRLTDSLDLRESF